MADEVVVRVPASIGVLSSATGERIQGGSVGRVTKREAEIYGLTPVVQEPAQDETGAHGDDEAEIHRLMELAALYEVQTTATTAAGLRRALEAHDIDPDEV